MLAANWNRSHEIGYEFGCLDAVWPGSHLAGMANRWIMATGLWAGLATAVFPSPSWADFVDGLQAFNTGDFDKAFREWLPLALEGNPDAQFNIGYMYANGFGLDENLAEAANWYRRSAETGIPDAQYNLALLYSSGRGVERNLERSAHWFLAAALRGHPEARLNMGMLLSVGAGVEPDLIEAYKWTGLAVRQLPEGERQDFAQDNLRRYELLLDEAEIADARSRIMRFSLTAPSR